MDRREKEGTFSSESSDRTWLPFSEQFQDFSTPDSDFSWPQESNGCHSAAGAGTAAASHSTFPQYLPNSPSDLFRIPAEIDVATNDIQYFSNNADPLYVPEFDHQTWRYPIISNPQLGYGLADTYAEPLYSAEDNVAPLRDTLPYQQYFLESGVSENPVLASTINCSDTTLITRHIDGQTSHPPMSGPISWTTPVTTSLTRPIHIKTVKGPRRKPTKNPKNARRSGPLDARTREKADAMRDVGACWRCKKYKKPCNGSTGVCDSCQVPGFRVWPSALGCRRERLDSLVLFLLPAQMEQKLLLIPDGWVKGRTWRVLKPAPSSINFEPSHNIGSNQWAVSKREARSCALFDVDYAELADIAEKYQNTRAKPIKALEASCTLLISTCKLYLEFVKTQDDTGAVNFGEIAKRATAVRLALRRTFSLVQQLCLSTKRTDWFPAFLSACLTTCAAIVFLDTAIAVPSPVREMIWGDFHEVRASMRQGGYQMLVDLLRASTNGVNPMLQQCWDPPGASGTEEGQKRKERYVLLGVDSAAVEGLMAMKAWREKYKSLLDEGRAMFAADAYTFVRIRPMAGIYKIFDF